MRRQLLRVCCLAWVLVLFLSSCVSGKEKYMSGNDDTPARVSKASIVEERRQTIGLLLSFYDVLSKDFGVGEWQPMEVQAQAEESLRLNCPVGYASERYRFAVAGPVSIEKWDAALARMHALAKPLGFGAPIKDPPGKNGGQSAFFTRPDGARIEIGYNVNSLIRIETACAKGEAFEGWPAGTELIPERLRSTGRHENGNPPETWAPYAPGGSPSAPVTSPSGTPTNPSGGQSNPSSALPGWSSGPARASIDSVAASSAAQGRSPAGRRAESESGLAVPRGTSPSSVQNIARLLSGDPTSASSASSGRNTVLPASGSPL